MLYSCVPFVAQEFTGVLDGAYNDRNIYRVRYLFTAKAYAASYLLVVAIGRYAFQKSKKIQRRSIGIIDDASDTEFFEMAQGGDERNHVSFLADIQVRASSSSI